MSETDQDERGETTPRINFRAALGEAGHEVADLGLEDVPDSGSLLHDAGHAEHEGSDALGPLTLGALGHVAGDYGIENPPDSDTD
jgi:hypothetical protein